MKTNPAVDERRDARTIMHHGDLDQIVNSVELRCARNLRIGEHHIEMFLRSGRIDEARLSDESQPVRPIVLEKETLEIECGIGQPMRRALLLHVERVDDQHRRRLLAILG